MPITLWSNPRRIEEVSGLVGSELKQGGVPAEPVQGLAHHHPSYITDRTPIVAQASTEPAVEPTISTGRLNWAKVSTLLHRPVQKIQDSFLSLYWL